jgi:probable F420-dependent oxidoreductase
MGADHEAVRARLGSVGAWTFAFDVRSAGQIRRDAADIEAMGYSALWVPEGSSSRDIVGHLGLLLDATERIGIASGIANITARQPEVLSAGLRTLADDTPGRLVAGIGIGHEYSTEFRGIPWSGPLARMRLYLDLMDAATSVPTQEEPHRLLAALGDGMLRLSAERALGAHSYFVPVSHTARARAVLGADPVLAVEQGVVVSSDLKEARRVAKDWARGYLTLPNYANNLRRLGFGDDEVEDGGSDALIEATFALGGVDAAVVRVREHLEAGADHVCLQVIVDDENDACIPQLRDLAAALSLSSAG